MAQAQHESLAGKNFGDYRFGDMIGKGGFGAVYKCLNIVNGECVAVKSIKAGKMSKSKMKDLEAEINLLKQLSDSPEKGNQYITHYIDSFNCEGCLHIVLEFCEQGSLTSIMKKYGVFPESLIALYMRQVLLGLVFLHKQGIIHRDIKGANILTTKRGEVKLADFGVSVFLDEQETASVAGTAYWMAPEVIELSGAREESDIWSVACTVIELLTTTPPYFNMAPMPAMFAIVQDDTPPIPEGLSPALNAFLSKTFSKNPIHRGKAEELLKHVFIRQAVDKKPVDLDSQVQSIQKREEIQRTINKTEKQKKRNTEAKQGMEEMIQKKKQPGGSKSKGKSKNKKESKSKKEPKSVPQPEPVKPKVTKAPKKEEDDDFFDFFDDFEDDFDSDAISKKIANNNLTRVDSTMVNMVTVKVNPQKMSISSKTNDIDKIAQSMAGITIGDDEDWENDFLSSDDDAMATIILPKKVETAPSTSASNGKADIRRADTFTRHPPTPPKIDTGTGVTNKRQIVNPSKFREMEDFDESIFDTDNSNTWSDGFNSTMKFTPKKSVPLLGYSGSVYNTQNKIEKANFAEYMDHDDEMNFDDDFDLSTMDTLHAKVPLVHNENKPQVVKMISLAKYEDNDFNSFGMEFNDMPSFSQPVVKSIEEVAWDSDFEDDGDDDLDFFDDDLDIEGDDTKREIDREFKATKQKISDLIKNLNESELEKLKESCLDLVKLLQVREQRLEIAKQYGMNALIGYLQDFKIQEARAYVLKVINKIIAYNVSGERENLCEHFCMLGGLPVALNLYSPKSDKILKMEVAELVRKCLQGYGTLQLFINCGGLLVLSQFLSEDYAANYEVVSVAIHGIDNSIRMMRDLDVTALDPDFKARFGGHFFDWDLVTKHHFALLMIRSDTHLHLVKNLLVTIGKEAEDSDILLRTIDHFSGLTEAVKLALTKENFINVFSQLFEMHTDESQLLRLIKIIKQITENQQVEVLKNLESTNFIPKLLKVVERPEEFKQDTLHNSLVITLFQSCHLNPVLLIKAANNHALEYLVYVLDRLPYMSEYVLQLLADFGLNSQSRQDLVKEHGFDYVIELFIDLVKKESDFQSLFLDIIRIKLKEDRIKVEDRLLVGDTLSCIVKNFGKVKFELDASLFNKMTSAVNQIVLISEKVSTALSKTGLVLLIIDRLKETKAIDGFARRELIEILRRLYETAERPEKEYMVYKLELTSELWRLQGDSALVIRNQVAKIVQAIENDFDN